MQPWFAGDETGSHRCDDKEEDGDSCVECWANSEDSTTKGKNKKKKKKSKKCEAEHVSGGWAERVPFSIPQRSNVPRETYRS